MSEHASNFELPKNIERYLAALSKLYAQDGNRQFQKIIVNAQIRVHEAWSSDNWNGGTYGHALFLTGRISRSLNRRQCTTQGVVRFIAIQQRRYRSRKHCSERAPNNTMGAPHIWGSAPHICGNPISRTAPLTSSVRN